MSSGVTVNDKSRDLFQAVKMRYSGKQKLRYAVFKLSDDLTQIVPDDERQCPTGACQEEAPTGKQPAEFSDLIQNLPKKDGRYIIYDYPYKGSFGPTSKIILIMWCPEEVAIKQKMVYASSKDALKKCFSDIGGEFQADCADDLKHDDIEGKLSKV